MVSIRRTAGVAAALSVLVLSGCRQDMQNQPRMYPQRGTAMFADGRSARPQVTGSVARSQADDTSYFMTGMVSGKEGDGMPLPVNMALLQRGQERFNIYCTACHSRVGNGGGEIVMRGYHLAGNFHTTRLREAPLGHFFSVMTHGYGSMPDYSAQLTPEDRWAVAAYIRALQLSQNAQQGDVKSGEPVRKLDVISEAEGLPANFVDEWTVPPTAGPSAPAVPKPADSALPARGENVGVAPATAANQKAAAPQPTATATQSPATGAGTSSAADIAAGRKVYLTNCAVCHQATRMGMPPNIPSLVGIIGRTSPSHVRTVLMSGEPQGHPPMPSFAGKLSGADVDHLIAFLGTGK